MAPGVFLQNLQGVIGPLAFAVELNVTRQTVVLHLMTQTEREGDQNMSAERPKPASKDSRIDSQGAHFCVCVGLRDKHN